MVWLSGLCILGEAKNSKSRNRFQRLEKFNCQRLGRQAPPAKGLRYELARELGDDVYRGLRVGRRVI
jgi:hypothetical protein